LSEDDEAVVTVCLLARGLCDIYDLVVGEGASVQQDAAMPPIARRALARLSRHCVLGGVEDVGSSIHLVMGRASGPLRDWGVPSFSGDFRYGDVELADGLLGVPTDDCRELARLGGSEIDVSEDVHHEQLRASVQAYPVARRHGAYTAIREFVVRHPVVPLDSLHRFITDGHVHAARAISGLYRPIPQGALGGGLAQLCGRCGSLLWPVRDPAFPDGRCQVRQCILEGDTVVGGIINQPSLYRLANAALLAFWVGPGLDEIRLHDVLLGYGRNSTLYPFSDAADVGLDGLDVGLDVKSYASPMVLAARLSRGIGGLAMFSRRIIVIPDYKLRLNPRYIDDLRASYVGSDALEFSSVSEAAREFGR
jgi:hypothetical protein